MPGDFNDDEPTLRIEARFKNARLYNAIRRKSVLLSDDGIDGAGERTLREIGEALGLSGQGAKRVIERAFRKLRGKHRSRYLRAHLDRDRRIEQIVD